MNTFRRRAPLIIPLATVAGLSNPTFAEQITIREGTALAKLVAEAKSHTSDIVIAAAPAIGRKISIPSWLAAH